MRITAAELKAIGPTLSAGILAADLLRLGAELESIACAGVTLVHVDVMDGVFCPMTTVGPPIVGAIPASFVKDVHLMIDEPLEKVRAYVECGADILTFHYEATRHPHRVLQSLDGAGVVRGVALTPGTPVSSLEPLLDELELVLLLAVNPGYAGQRFVAGTVDRVRAAKELIGDREIAVAVDGGVTAANASRIAGWGIDVLVAGSAVFDGSDPGANARGLLGAIATPAAA